MTYNKTFAFYSRSYDNTPVDYMELYELKVRRLALGLSVDVVYTELGSELSLSEATDLDRLENGDFRLTRNKYKIISDFYNKKEEAEKERLDYLLRVQGGCGLFLDKVPTDNYNIIPNWGN